MAKELPTKMTPDSASQTLPQWLDKNSETLSELLINHGAVLFRGFPAMSAKDFDMALKSYSGPSFDYEFRSNDRIRLVGNIFSSTEFPATEVIPFHNEMSYSATWPDRLWLYCVLPSETGGSTPIADSRKVLDAIPDAVRDRFSAGVTYVRNMRKDLDLPWQEVFQTNDREWVGDYCERHQIRYEWAGLEHLRTWQWRPATHWHPTTGEEVWFNQAHLFHYTARGTEIAEWLLRQYGQGGLPRNALLGDSEPISEEDLEAIGRAYDCNRVEFGWQAGDVLLIDNVLMAHAREAFTGKRNMLVGLTGTGKQRETACG
jgi:alpha-ketoglutarate-dependent taurine dioxygenase